MISHELRAPLARMQGFSRMMLDLALDSASERFTHVAQRIEASSLRMREVIDTLLEMTRLSLEKVAPEALDLSVMAKEVLETLVQEGSPRPGRVTIAEGARTWGDRRMLGLCLRNLLQNALKFSSKTPRSEVEFGVIHRDERCVYFVRDNGAGFNMAHAGKLFQAFVRLHRQEEFEGIGVGLNLVRKVMEKHGGRVWGQATPGLGATFYFTLGQESRGSA